LSQPFQGARDKVNSGKMAEPHTYVDSPVVERTCGALFAAVRYRRLRDLRSARRHPVLLIRR
ncbi:hypothetical protein, partial [Kitasatospora sp. NPDC093558]|uniref:hypothetical protein n=1 Tax=Kitasatospora sp. NPDC093558 TaxID=3155201 RepID=UPI003415CDC2